MKKLLAFVILVLSAGLCLSALANDSATVGVGGSVMLMRDHPTVVMESAKINIHLASDRVECNYVLQNTGGETDVLVGFPERSWGADVVDAGFKDFRSYVDGQEVPVKPLPALRGVDGGFDRFWVKQVHFAEGQTRAVRNTYFGGHGSDIGGFEWFVYDVSTAASWKGIVSDIRVSVDLTDMGPNFQVDGIHPSGYDRSKDKIVWNWKDIEPTENICIEFCRWYRAIWVDGTNEWTQHVTRPAAPSMATGVLIANVFSIAGWLGLDEPSEPAGDKPATLTGRGKSMTLLPGQSVASVDGREVALGAPARRSEGYPLEAPVIPVAEAFGFSARFDSLTRRTYLFSPEALGAAKPSEWLTRRLTEEDLRDKPSEELRLMRNEVYARRGREFRNKGLRHHFYCQPWYQPKPNYTDALLNETDCANIALVTKVEKERPSAPVSGSETPEMDADRGFNPLGLPAALRKWWMRESSGHGQAEDPLIACLNDEDAEARFQAAWLLGMLGDKRAVEPLIACLKDPMPEQRTRVAEGLAVLGDKRAVVPLIACLKDGDAQVRYAAAVALRALKYEPATAEERATLLVALRDWVQLAQGGPAAATALMVCFTSYGTTFDRADAEKVLLKLGAAAVDPLVACLEDPDKNIRWTSTVMLGKLGNARAVGPLVGCLKGEDLQVLRETIYALGMIGDTRAVEPLIPCLKDNRSEVRNAATQALKQLGYKREGAVPGGN